MFSSGRKTPGAMSPGGGKAGDMPADTLHAIIAQQALPGKGDLPGPILAAVRLD